MPEEPCSFRQVDEKHVSVEVDMMCWSPKMDLIAIANVQGEVNLHRLSWQKVWNRAASVDGDRVMALTWRPDGKVLAVGYASGQVILCDIEDSSVLHTCPLHSKVTCMAWVDRQMEQNPQQQQQQQHPDLTTDNPRGCRLLTDESFLPKLPAFSKTYTATNRSQSDNSYEDLKKVKSQKELNLLLVGEETGHLHMFAYGIFSVGAVDLSLHGASADKGQGRVLSAFLSHDLHLLSLIVDMGAEGDSEAHCVSLISYDTTLLASRHTEVMSLAHKFGQILSLTSYLSSTIQQMTDAWEDILMEMDSKLIKFADDKRKVCGGAVSNDFLRLLMLGMPSDELQQFLLHDLTEKGLKKLGHSIETSYSNIQKLILKHLHSVGQSLVYHLSEVRGMSQWYDKYGVLGLSPDTVQKALTMAGSFMLKASELQQVIDGSMKNFKAFYRWLYVLIQKLSGEPVPQELSKMTQQDLNFVAQFLSENFSEEVSTEGKSGFNLEKVGQYLKDEDLTDMPDNRRNPWVQFVEQTPALKECPLLYPVYPDKSLIQMYSLLSSHFEGILHKCASVIGKSFQSVTSQQLFTRISKEDQEHGYSRISQMSRASDEGGQCVYTAYTTEEPPCQTCVLLRQKSAASGSCAEAVSFTVGKLGGKADDSISSLKCSDHTLVDLSFYNEDTLTLLLQEEEEDSVPVLAQLSLTALEEHFVKLDPQQSVADSNLDSIDVGPLIDDLNYRRLENMKASQFAVSGKRNVACVLFSSKRRVRLFMMDAEDEDDDDDNDEEMSVTLPTGSHDNSQNISSHDNNVTTETEEDPDENKENKQNSPSQANMSTS